MMKKRKRKNQHAADLRIYGDGYMYPKTKYFVAFPGNYYKSLRREIEIYYAGDETVYKVEVGY